MREWPGPERSIIAFAVGATAACRLCGLRGVGIPAVASRTGRRTDRVARDYWLASRLPDA